MKWLLIIAAAAAGFYFINQNNQSDKREYLKNVNVFDPAWLEAVKQFTGDEVETVYEFITKYDERHPVPEGSELQKRLIAISTKYNVFT